jgi:curved DNA-binding protein
MEFKDYYKILGVAEDADDKAIKLAYRRLARQYHPDVSQHADAEEKFKAVAEAYEVLHHADKRAQYDELRLARQRRPSGHYAPGGSSDAQTNQDFADFFQSIFGAAGAHQHSRPFTQAPNTMQRGQDVEIEWPLFLEDTLADNVKPLEYSVQYPNQRGQLQQLKKKLNVKIPAGTREGERIRLKGQGAPGIGDAPAGDLYLHIRMIPHPLFDVEGHHLLITLPIAPWEAALGAKITLPTLTGKIQLSVPANSQSGQRLRIKGKGLPSKNGPGDLFAVIKIVMPPVNNLNQANHLNDTNQAAIQHLWTQLAEKAAFDPRAQWSQSS